ncbi:MAG: S-layer homology domain-containing protein [Candidatus Aminicenantia bacterium]
MVTKISYSAIIILLLLTSCVSYERVTQTIYLDDFPQEIVTQLSLDERIAAEDGWACLRQGRIGKAFKIFVKMDSNNPAACIGLAYTYLLRGDFSISEEWFKRALEIHPDLPIIHFGLGQLYQKTGKDDLALVEFRRVLDKEPNNKWAKYYYQTIRTRKTEQLLREAEYFFRHNQDDKGAELLIKALYYSPDLLEPHLKLAQYYKNNTKGYENAIRHYKIAISLQPENLAIKKELADLLYLSKKYKEADEIYQELLKIEPDDPQIKKRLDLIQKELVFIELPRQFNDIPSKKTINKADLASLIAIKFKDIWGRLRVKPPIVVDISTSWAAQYILEVTALRLLDVYPNHTFRPEEIITRGEMAQVLSRLIDFLTSKDYRLVKQFSPEDIHLSDVSPEHFYYQPIVKVVSYQLMDLLPGYQFKPFQELSGQEAVTIIDTLARLIE